MVLVAVLSTCLLASFGVAQAATTVPLGATDGFAILAGSTITNTGPGTVTGDVGLHDGSSVTGLGDITQNGKAYWVLTITLVLFVASAFSYRNSRR